MSYSRTILTAMKADKQYSPVELSCMTGISEDSTQQVLNTLVKGGVIEYVSKDRFRKNKKYKTKQRDLKFNS